tara:strand:- start:49 stop:327 length:279 start_codon:yes stop_codon:yes gene_type:complete
MKWVSHNKLIVEKTSSKETLSECQNEFYLLAESVALFNYKLNMVNRVFCCNKMYDKEKKTLLLLLDSATTTDEIKKIIKINKLQTNLGSLDI